MFGVFDQKIHSQSTADTAEEYASTLMRVMGLKATPGTNFAASFGHLAGGYDATYYGYMWAEVYSADMFERFEREGLMSEATGLSYRQEILAAGGTRDSAVRLRRSRERTLMRGLGQESLRRFLGREPDMRAFLVSKGLQV